MPDLTTKDALLERMVTATENLATNVPAKFDEYLPLTGGTMTGDIGIDRQIFQIQNNYSDNSGRIFIKAASSYKNGAQIYVNGINASLDPGAFALMSATGTGSYKLVGNSTGSLTWDGQPVQTSSDKRLKQDFSDVPADVLKAWGKVEWKQFKYKADVERKGDSCRFHTGLVAQDVKAVGDKNKVDLCKYGILCHNVREATEDSEAVDMWTIRYEEALAMEVIYLRNEIKKLQSEIRKLKKA